jgi:4-hydroxybenzoate polyprenyltransferase
MTPAASEAYSIAKLWRPAWRSFVDCLRLARPYSLLWFIVLPATTMALWLRGESLPVGKLALLLVSLALADGGLTTLNEISDRHTDRASTERQRHSRPIAAGNVSIKAAYAQLIVLEGCAAAIALFVSPIIFALVILGIGYGFVYSAQPLYASGRPFVSQLFWVALWPAMYLTVYVAMKGDLLAGLPYIGATVLFMGIGETLAKDLRDIDNDGATGKRTTPVVIGAGPTTVAAAISLTLASITYLLAAALANRGSPALLVALTVLMGLWLVRVFELISSLRAGYTKAAARSLHMGCIRTFLIINLLFITGLGTR